MNLDPTLLARIQFGFTVSFHIIFPAMSIGLGIFLVVIEALWLKTRNAVYLEIYRFWLKIFAMGFGIGVVTGIVLSFEFGLAFAKFSQIAGPVVGSLISYEVLTAFFLEAGFLGIMLFGLQRVGPRLHFLATCMVSLGTQISASWILAANSWMQTPSGAVLEGGRFVVHSWREVIVNPSWPVRLPHMLMAAYLTGAFLVAGVGAWYLLKGRHLEFARKTVSLGIGMATLLIGVQVFIGDILYGTMLQLQPAKLQAAEGFWERQSESPAPYYWIIVPDQAGQKNRLALGTPYLGSIWLTHSLTGRVAGLKNTPRDRQPLMAMTFYGFRVMYGIGIVMFALGGISLWLRWKRRLFSTRWFLRMLVAMTPAGAIATLGGWYLAETGRQPWVIYGVLRTSEAVSPVPAPVLLASLISFVCVYGLFLTAFLIFVARIIRQGPAAIPAANDATGLSRSARRLLAPHSSVGAAAADTLDVP